MESCKLSFIVPIFNGEKFLRKCIDSLLRQDTPHSEYEIILINDYSDDGSDEVIMEYVNKYENIVYHKNDRNLKVGTTCNIGLRKAKGEYLWFVGQDDWIKENSTGFLLQNCIEKNLDLLLFNYSSTDQSGNVIHDPKDFVDSALMKGLDFINQYFNKSFIYYLLGYEWRALYKNTFLKDYNITFPDGVIFEDTTFLFKSLIYSNRMCSIENTYYYYRRSEHSIMHNYKYNFKGDLIYEFAFITGAEVGNLSNDLRNIDKPISQILEKKSVEYFESFARKVILSSINDKIIFYSLLQRNKKLTAEKVRKTSAFAQLIAIPYLGFLLSLLLKPFYILKRSFKKR